VGGGSGGSSHPGLSHGQSGDFRRQRRWVSHTPYTQTLCCNACRVLHIPHNNTCVHDLRACASTTATPHSSAPVHHAGLGNDLDFKDMSNTVNKNGQFFKVCQHALRC